MSLSDNDEGRGKPVEFATSADEDRARDPTRHRRDCARSKTRGHDSGSRRTRNESPISPGWMCPVGLSPSVRSDDARFWGRATRGVSQWSSLSRSGSRGAALQGRQHLVVGGALAALAIAFVSATTRTDSDPNAPARGAQASVMDLGRSLPAAPADRPAESVPGQGMSSIAIAPSTRAIDPAPRIERLRPMPGAIAPSTRLIDPAPGSNAYGRCREPSRLRRA